MALPDNHAYDPEYGVMRPSFLFAGNRTHRGVIRTNAGNIVWVALQRHYNRSVAVGHAVKHGPGMLHNGISYTQETA